MKILWFTNSPCGSVRRFSKTITSGGWMISLEDEIKKNPDIRLSVAYMSSVKESPFEYDGVNYYPVYREMPQNRIKRVLSRLEPYEAQDRRILPQLLEVVDAVRPDLIHIHGTEECFGLIQDVIKDTPIVFSIQGLIAPYKEKYFSGMAFHDVRKYESIQDKLKQVSVLNEYKSFCYRAERENHYLANAKYVLGRTFWDRDCTLALNPKRKYFIVNEILRDAFYRKRWNKEAFGKTVRLVSTISGGIYKGFETVLKTASLLSAYAGVDFEWHIAGYTGQTKWVKIAERITGIKVSDLPIVFHGRIDADKLSDLLVSSDIYVHVSHIENSPNSVCEAMLLGMPVIASFAGGTASLLEDGKEGLLYQDGDPYVLAGAIVNLQQDKDKAVSYGMAARERAVIRHDRMNIVNGLIDIYGLIIKDFGKSAKSR